MLSSEQEDLVEAQRPTPWDTVVMDMEPRPITLQDVCTCLQAAGEEGRKLLRTELDSDIRLRLPCVQADEATLPRLLLPHSP